MGVFTTQTLLSSVGVSRNRATPGAVAINWILKVGIIFQSYWWCNTFYFAKFVSYCSNWFKKFIVSFGCKEHGYSLAEDFSFAEVLKFWKCCKNLLRIMTCKHSVYASILFFVSFSLVFTLLMQKSPEYWVA